jgi:hypothetical protein
MLDLRPKQPKPTIVKGKRVPPPPPAPRKPASLKSSNRTLAQRLNIRPDVSKIADELERVEKKKKEDEAPPKRLLPVPKAIQITGKDPLRDLYLEQAGLKKEEVIVKTKPATNTPQEYADLLQHVDKIPDQALDAHPSFVDQLKGLGN